MTVLKSWQLMSIHYKMNNKNEQTFNERQLKRIFYRRLAVVLWASFLVASIQTMFFFAVFDPQLLAEISTWNITLSPIQGYTVGFIFFWIFNLLTAIMVGLVMVLPRTKLANRKTPIDE